MIIVTWPGLLRAQHNHSWSDPGHSHISAASNNISMTTLPEFMIGDFQMETSEGFNDFMYEMGVNFVTRNIANNLYPLQKISQDLSDELVTLGENINSPPL